MLIGCCHCDGHKDPPPPPSESVPQASLDSNVIHDCSSCDVAPARFKLTMTIPEFSGRCAVGCAEYKKETLLYYTGACTWDSVEKAMNFSGTVFFTTVCCDMTDSKAEVRYRLQIPSFNTYTLRMVYYSFGSGNVRASWTMSGTFGSGDCLTSRTLLYASKTSNSTLLLPPPCAAAGGFPQSPCGTAFSAAPTSGTVSASIEVG